MRKLFENRYFLIIWGVVVVAFNAVLFLSVAAWKQEAFELAAFWGLYACVMLAFVSVLLICLLHKKNNYEQSILMTLVAPLATVAILVGIVLLFCIDKIDLIVVDLPAPLCPINANKSPFSIVKERSLTATFPPLYFFV